MLKEINKLPKNKKIKIKLYIKEGQTISLQFDKKSIDNFLEICRKILVKYPEAILLNMSAIG